MKKHLDADRRILGEIYSSGEIARNMRDLCDMIPHRFAGSVHEKTAAGRVALAMRRYGLSNVGIEPFRFEGWTRTGQSKIAVKTEPGYEIDCIALPYSPSTKPGGLDIELADLGWCSPEEVAAKGAQARGKAVLVQLGAPQNYRRLHRAEQYGRAVEAGAAAFLFVNSDSGCLEPTGSARFGREAEIPAVGLSRENGALLKRLLSRGKVRLNVLTRGRTSPMTSRNVSGEITGRSGEIVVMGGHLDSHDISPGAADNASGIAAVLECAHALRAAGIRPRRTIRFVTFGCEEHGLHGSEAYMRRHEHEAGRMRFMLNIDTVPASHPMGIEFHRWPKAARYVSAVSEELNRPVPVTQAVCLYSDHFNFFRAGVPSARIVSEGDPRSVRGFGHTRGDTLEKVNFEMIRSAADLAARFILRAADDPAWPLRRRPPAESEAFVKAEGKDEILKYEK